MFAETAMDSRRLADVIQLLLQQAGVDAGVQALEPQGGGCINDCYGVRTASGNFFLKVNQAKTYPGMFQAEARGLELIHRNVPGFAPAVIGLHETDTYQFLLLEDAGGGRPSADFWETFARHLVRLHRCTQQSFGLDHDNYIGSLRQINQPQASWPDFYVACRLMPQVRLGMEKGLFSPQAATAVEQLHRRLPDLFPDEPPALLHGDLWSGNYLVHVQGLPVVIDPAVYFGFREMDLAMMDLFGGFDRRLRQHYEEWFPLEPGYDQRRPLLQLYPLLVHANLFGGHNTSAAWEILRDFR
ncbi:MAG: fructosamine kinase family protein [Chitinophagales bacterium]|nr:fructosamine kinase family protein [Chitinophagales bacterium]